MAKIFKKVGKNKIVVPLNFEWPREPFVFLDASGSRIVIEEHVTFGSGVVVSKCKIIGQHSVIGAGSVVTCNIPPYEIWAGNPAKKIGDVKK